MGGRTGDETLEEGLVAEVGVVLLEVLGGCGHQLDGDKLESVLIQLVRCEICAIVCKGDEPTPLEALDDLADESTLYTIVSSIDFQFVACNSLPGRHPA